MKRCKSKKGKF